jgi:hypothetical protein
MAKRRNSGDAGGWGLGLVKPLLLPLLLAAGLVAIGISVKQAFFTDSPPTFVSTGPTVTQLEKLGQITVLKLTVSDVLQGEGYGYKGAWLVKGDVLYSIDMTQAKVVETSEGSKTATISLPLPQVVSPRVDHNRTVTYSVDKKSWIPFTGDQSKLRDRSMKEAQDLVERAAARSDNVDVARRNAEMLVALMYKLVGWTVDVVWVDETRPATTPPAENNLG